MHLLPFRSLKVKVLWRTQRLAHKRILGDPGDLLGCAFSLDEVALGLNKARFKLVEATDNEHVVRSLE